MMTYAELREAALDYLNPEREFQRCVVLKLAICFASTLSNPPTKQEQTDE